MNDHRNTPLGDDGGPERHYQSLGTLHRGWEYHGCHVLPLVGRTERTEGIPGTGTTHLQGVQRPNLEGGQYLGKDGGTPSSQTIKVMSKNEEEPMTERQAWLEAIRVFDEAHDWLEAIIEEESRQADLKRRGNGRG